MWLVPLKKQAKTAKIVAVGGDGIGPETVAATVRAIQETGAQVEISSPVHGKASIDQGGEAFPYDLKKELEAADGILFGACDTSIGHAAPILIHIRFRMQTYANLRPALHIPTVPGRIGDSKTNMVIVRELTEGLYPGREGDLKDVIKAFPDLKDHFGGDYPPGEGAFALRIITEHASRRVGRYAAKLAKHRMEQRYSPGKVTVVTKKNIFRKSDTLFQTICEEEIEKVGGLTVDHLYIDEASRQVVASPNNFDVVVTANLFGDVMSDVASEIMGGMPMCPSASIGDKHCYFESCHGSAPDIMGQDKANPAATMLSGAMMLEHLGYDDEARTLFKAVFDTIESGVKTGDLGGSATTSSYTDAVCRAISS